jgi:hypothetical protein
VIRLKHLKTAGVMLLSIIFSMGYSFIGVMIVVWYFFTDPEEGKYIGMDPFLHEILILGIALLHILIFIFLAVKISKKIFKIKWQKVFITILSIFIVFIPYILWFIEMFIVSII